MLGNTRPKHAQTEKRKTCLADFVAEMQREEAEEAARIQEEEEQARRMTRQQRVEAEKKRLESQSRFERSLRKDQIQPLVDLAYSESMLVQRSAVGLLATLSINADNKDILISAGSLKPLLANCSPEVDFVVRRQALQGLANMTSREDIRARMCSIPGGLKVIIDGVKAADMQSRLAAAEACANIASSMKLRGRLVQEGVLPAVASMLYARAPELKRWGMVALQRLSMSASAQGNVVQTKEDPEGDGYASEIVNEGVLPPLLQLLRGGPQIEEDLRTIAMQSIYEICNASDEVRVRLCREHAELLKVVVGLMLLDEFPGARRSARRAVWFSCSASIRTISRRYLRQESSPPSPYSHAQSRKRRSRWRRWCCTALRWTPNAAWSYSTRAGRGRCATSRVRRCRAKSRARPSLRSPACLPLRRACFRCLRADAAAASPPWPLHPIPSCAPTAQRPSRTWPAVRASRSLSR